MVSVNIIISISYYFPGNCLTCFVVWKDRKTSAMSLLMINLAIVDTLILFVWSNELAIPGFCNYFKGCQFYQHNKLAIWVYGWPFGSTFQLAGTWSIVSITFSRFVSVCWPSHASIINSRRHIQIRILVMHIACILFSSVRFAEVYVVYDKRGNMLPKKTALASSPVYNYMYSLALYYFITYLVPLSLLVYFTVKLSISLREMNKKRHEMSRKAKERTDLTFSLVIVVVVFIFCQLSNPIRRLLYIIYAPSTIGCGTLYFYFSSLTVMFVNFNSACNFFIFCVCSPGFRRQLNHIFRRSRRIEPIGLFNSNTMNRGDRKTNIDGIEN